MYKKVVLSAAAAVSLALASAAGAAGSGAPALQGAKKMGDADIAALKSRAKSGPMAKLNPQLSALVAGPKNARCGPQQTGGGNRQRTVAESRSDGFR